VRAVAPANGLQDAPGLIGCGELGQEGGLGDAEHRRGRVGALGLQERQCGGGVRPGAQDAGQAAADQVCVEGVRGAQSEGVGGLGWVERAEDDVVGAPVEGAVVRRQPLHHVQVAAQEQQEDGSAREQPVPRGLQGAVEHGVLLREPRHLVDHHDDGPVRQDRGQCPKCVGPASGSPCGHEILFGRQRGLGEFGQEVGHGLHR